MIRVHLYPYLGGWCCVAQSYRRILQKHQGGARNFIWPFAAAIGYGATWREAFDEWSRFTAILERS